MNFIKLIPILFLAHPPLGDARPAEQQLLPAIPGYVPVYIQTGNVPPDVGAFYQSGRTKTLAIPPLENEPIKGEEEKNKEVAPLPENEEKGDLPTDVNHKEGAIEKIDKPAVDEEPVDEKKTEEPSQEIEVPRKPIKDSTELHKPIGQIKEIAHYEVKEPQQE